MAASGTLSARSPTMKRIQREALELTKQPSPDFTAFPLESNLYEWHFTLRGPPAPSPFAGGIYHGRILLPSTYPLRPPSFRFLTPSGRFEVNREICLSISGHHEETWQPAWGIRTALVAIRSFMDTDAKGQVGGLDTTRQVREHFARDSRRWKCSCADGKSNEDIIRDLEETCMADQHEQCRKEADAVPQQLSFVYRDELVAASQAKPASEAKKSIPAPILLSPESRPRTRTPSPTSSCGSPRLRSYEQYLVDGRHASENLAIEAPASLRSTPRTSPSSSPSSSPVRPAFTRTRSPAPPLDEQLLLQPQVRVQTTRQTASTSTQESLFMDAAIVAIFLALLTMIMRKIAQCI